MAERYCVNCGYLWINVGNQMKWCPEENCQEARKLRRKAIASAANRRYQETRRVHRRDHENEQARVRYASNLEEGRKKSRKWRIENPEKAAKATRAWQERNPGRLVDTRHRYQEKLDARTATLMGEIKESQK